MKKRILSAMLAAVMLVAMIPAFSVATGADAIDWANDKEIVIKSVDDFLAFRSQIRAGNTFVGKTVELGADLDLTGVSEAKGKNGKMGGIDSGFYFAGTFDGKFHTISNMTVDGHGYQGALFGAIPDGLETTAVIKNLGIIDANVQGSTRFSLFYGAIYSAAVFENLYIKANVAGSGDSSGGVVGYLWKSNVTFKNCVFEGTVTNGGGAGAFVGQIRDDASVKVSLTFENCLNVSSNPLVGAYAVATNPKETVINSYNYYESQMGTGNTANAPEGFSTRSSGYPVPTPLLPFFAEATALVEIKGLDGAVLEKYDVGSEGIIIDKLPELDTQEQYFWFDLSTGAIVKAPLTLTSSTVIAAKSFGRNETAMLGVQLGAVSGGKQDIRFIGGTYNLEGVAVGVEITVKYKDASGSVVERTYKKLVHNVYGAINATENGEMVNVTAAELGAPYLYAIVLEDVPTDAGQLDVTVKSIKAVGNGNINISGTEMSFSMINGAVDSHLTPLP